jgi:hypothetical protein
MLTRIALMAEPFCVLSRRGFWTVYAWSTGLRGRGHILAARALIPFGLVLFHAHLALQRISVSILERAHDASIGYRAAIK